MEFPLIGHFTFMTASDIVYPVSALHVPATQLLACHVQLRDTYLARTKPAFLCDH